MDIYLFCIVQKEFIFIKIAKGIVIEMGLHCVLFVVFNDTRTRETDVHRHHLFSLRPSWR